MNKTGNIAGRTRQETLATAYHEAGHVVIGYELGFPLGKKGVSTVPDGETAGRADMPYGFRYRPDADRSERAGFRVEQYAMVDFAAVGKHPTTLTATRRLLPRALRKAYLNDRSLLKLRDRL